MCLSGFMIIPSCSLFSGNRNVNDLFIFDGLTGRYRLLHRLAKANRRIKENLSKYRLSAVLRILTVYGATILAAKDGNVPPREKRQVYSDTPLCR